MVALQSLVEAGAWDLPLPLTVRGVLIDEAALDGHVRASAADPVERVLKLTRPMMRGDDVLAVQKALNMHKIELDTDSVFGTDTEKAVIRFQIAKGLTVDGAVGPATLAALLG